MPKEKLSLTERLASSFKQLAVVSDEGHIAITGLGIPISTVESALHVIGIGVSAWHPIAQGGDDKNGNYWSREIGYSKVGTKWCIALKRTWGNQFHDIGDGEEVWKFAEAPRWMVIEAVGKIPDLLDVLLERSTQSLHEIKAKTVQAQEFASVLTGLAAEIAESRKKAAK